MDPRTPDPALPDSAERMRRDWDERARVDAERSIYTRDAAGDERDFNIMRVSRVAEPKAQESLVTDIIQGKSNREIREKIKEVKAPRASSEKAPEHATHKIATDTATIVIRFNKTNPSKEDIIQVIRDALASLKS